MPHLPGLTMHPSRAPLGAEIVGVDLAADVDEATFRAIEDAYNTHTVQTPPRPPCHQWELKPTGSSRGKSPLGSARFSL
jgi:hypothetical protein